MITSERLQVAPPHVLPFRPHPDVLAGFGGREGDRQKHRQPPPACARTGNRTRTPGAQAEAPTDRAPRPAAQAPPSPVHTRARGAGGGAGGASP